MSEHHKREILTPEGGAGLDIVLRENAHKLTGILHGADYKRWNPATDPFLPALYDPSSLWGKKLCRDSLLNHLKLELGPKGPVFGMVTRVVKQKGFEILVPLLDRLLSDDVRLIIIGEGDPGFETALAVAARKYPRKFSYQRHYDEQLAHLVEGAIDITLIPSRFEPAGLAAMYSLKYAALPVAGAAGGIQEIIEDYDPTTDRGYGFLFYEYSTEALWDAIKRAREVFNDPGRWMTLAERAMSRDFSWDASAQRYERIYREIASAGRSGRLISPDRPNRDDKATRINAGRPRPNPCPKQAKECNLRHRPSTPRQVLALPRAFVSPRRSLACRSCFRSDRLSNRWRWVRQ